MENLYQVSNEPLEKFFERVDCCGGWPLDKKYAQYSHVVGNERPVEFSNQSVRHGWATTFCSSDDYYFWKLSDQKKEELIKEGRKQLLNEIKRLAL